MSEPRVIWLEDDPELAIRYALGALTSEGVVVFPTDTVYGLLSISYSQSAFKRIFQLKGRDFNQPLALLIQSQDLAFNEIYPQAAGTLIVERDIDVPQGDDIAGPMFWDGKLTAIVKPDTLTEYTPEINAIQPGPVGMRVTRHPVLERVIEGAGWLWATSVNRSGQSPATKSKDVLAWLDELRERGIDPPELVVLSRTPGSGKPSRVVDLTGDEPQWIR